MTEKHRAVLHFCLNPQRYRLKMETPTYIGVLVVALVTFPCIISLHNSSYKHSNTTLAEAQVTVFVLSGPEYLCSH